MLFNLLTKILSSIFNDPLGTMCSSIVLKFLYYEFGENVLNCLPCFFFLSSRVNHIKEKGTIVFE